MKTIKKLMMMTLALSAVVFSSCKSDETPDNDDQIVYFTDHINAMIAGETPQSRAAGINWADGDTISIFMIGSTGDPIANNRHYTTTANGTFAPAANNEIYYPLNGSAVKFVAYYPNRNGAMYKTPIPVTIGDQTKQPTFDLLYAAPTGTYSKGSAPVPLAFSHKLSKFVLNCKADANVGGTLSDLAVRVEGMNSVNSFDLVAGTLGTPSIPSPFVPNKIATAATFVASYDAIIMPGTYAANAIKVTFTTAGETYTWNVSPGVTFVSGYEYTYAITLTRTGVQVTATIGPWLIGTQGTGTAD